MRKSNQPSHWSTTHFENRLIPAGKMLRSVKFRMELRNTLQSSHWHNLVVTNPVVVSLTECHKLTLDAVSRFMTWILALRECVLIVQDLTNPGGKSALKILEESGLPPVWLTSNRRGLVLAGKDVDHAQSVLTRVS